MKQHDRYEVDEGTSYLHQHHSERQSMNLYKKQQKIKRKKHFTYLSINVQYLNEDEGCEGDHDYVGEGVSEHEQSHHQDTGTLEDGLKDPNHESLNIHAPSFLKGLVEWWITEHGHNISILIKYK